MSGWVIVGIAALLILATLGYVIYTSKEQEKKLKEVQRSLWGKLVLLLNQKGLPSPEEKERIQAELEALSRETTQRPNKVAERWLARRKDPDPK